MPNEGASGELASARLEIPTMTQRTSGAAQPDVRALEASIHAVEDGALMVTVRTEPSSQVWTLPLLAWLQFIGRCEEAVTAALTSNISGAVNS
jgi:hypothetical protein